jgi:hypothetical protein
MTRRSLKPLRSEVLPNARLFGHYTEHAFGILGDVNTKGDNLLVALSFKEPAKCAKSMRQQRGKDEWEKGQSQSQRTYFTLERKADTHGDPCRQTNWSGIIRAPGLVGVGQKSER